MPDVPALVITLLLVGLLLVLGEMARALVTGEMIALRRPRRPLVVEWHVVAIAVLFLLVFVVPAVVESLAGHRPREKASDASVIFSIIANFVILGGRGSAAGRHRKKPTWPTTASTCKDGGPRCVSAASVFS